MAILRPEVEQPRPRARVGFVIALVVSLFMVTAAFVHQLALLQQERSTVAALSD